MNHTHLLSDTIKSLSESATIKMAQMARDLKSQGHQVISLSLGEPDFDTPLHIKEAAQKALDEGYTKYTPVPGLLEFRQAISEKFKRDNDLDYGVDQIVVSNGAKQCIANVCMVLCNPEDEVLILTPFWVSYGEIVKMTGAKPILLKAGIEDDYKVKAEALKKAITPKTKLIIFSSPCNPTGSVYNREELKAMADVINEHPEVMVISDEIYEYINFKSKHVSIGAFDNVKDQTITVNGMSKGFAMTGWRLGYLGAPKWVAKACSKLQGQFTSGATAFGQMAAAHALKSSLQHTYEMVEAFKSRRDLVIRMLKEIPGVNINQPDGAFYVFPDISSFFGKTDGQFTINNADDFAELLLTKAHVAVVTGSAFGADECIRISYAASEEDLTEACERMKKCLAAFA